jgi:hypothetical protein
VTARHTRALIPFAGQVAASLVAFALLERAIVGLGRLPPSAYEQPFIAPQILTRLLYLLGTSAPLAVMVGGGAVAAVTAVLVARNDERWRQRLRSIVGTWTDIEHGSALRWLLAVVTGVATLAAAAYPYNAYFDHAHAVDRLLLVACWGAFLWRPVFALPFALILSAIAGQFHVPLLTYSWTEMELLVRLPILFGAFWMVRALMLERRVEGFVFLLSCLIAVTWWSSGWGKIRVGWLTHPHVELLLVGAHANGWLGFLPAESITRAAGTVSALRLPLMLMTLLVECGALFLLWRRWSLPVFLVLTSTFHVAAFALTGILFWKWILVEMAFLAFLLWGGRVSRLQLFSPAQFAMAVIVILAHPLWVEARNLTWFDTPLTYSIELRGIDAAGEAHELPAGFFRPYSETFVLDPFPYLSRHGQLTGAMGVTQSRGLAEALVAATAPEDVFALERARARQRYDAERSAQFDRFVVRTMRVWNREARPGRLARAGAPRHLWTFPLDADWRGTPAIHTVRVVEVTHFYDGRRLREIRRRTLRTIDVHHGTGVAAPS